MSEILGHCKLSLKLQTWGGGEKHPSPEIRRSKSYGDKPFKNIQVYSLLLLKMQCLDCIDLRYISAQDFQSPQYFFFLFFCFLWKGFLSIRLFTQSCFSFYCKSYQQGSWGSLLRLLNFHHAHLKLFCFPFLKIPFWGGEEKRYTMFSRSWPSTLTPHPGFTVVV